MSVKELGPGWVQIRLSGYADPRVYTRAVRKMQDLADLGRSPEIMNAPVPVTVAVGYSVLLLGYPARSR